MLDEGGISKDHRNSPETGKIQFIALLNCMLSDFNMSVDKIQQSLTYVLNMEDGPDVEIEQYEEMAGKT